MRYSTPVLVGRKYFYFILLLRPDLQRGDKIPAFEAEETITFIEIASPAAQAYRKIQLLCKDIQGLRITIYFGAYKHANDALFSVLYILLFACAYTGTALFQY